MLPKQSASKAFCSTANLGSGFDVLGLALDKYADTVRVRLTQTRRIRVSVWGRDARLIPEDPARNSAGPPAKALLEEAHVSKGLDIRIEKRVPAGLGLGSSGATAAACAKAVDCLLNLHLSNDELVGTASLGEMAVSGAAHADNVAASMLGGFVIVYDQPPRTVSVKPPSNLVAVVVTPHLLTGQNKTRRARKVVPKIIEVSRAILNIGRASAIVAGFVKGEIGLIGTGMEDEIAEPHRRELIPGFSIVKRLALEAGAAGVSISGAGPSILALVDRKSHNPRRVGRAMAKGFGQNNVRSTWFVAKPAPGARIIETM